MSVLFSDAIFDFLAVMENNLGVLIVSDKGVVDSTFELVPETVFTSDNVDVDDVEDLVEGAIADNLLVAVLDS